MGSPLNTLSQADLDALLYALPELKTAGARNRYRATLRSILRRAVRWGILDQAPCVILEPEMEKDLPTLTREQATQLIQAAPAHLQPVIRFALATGLRKANILGLQWPRVDWTNQQLQVSADDAKGKRILTLPLNQTALAVLQGEKGKHDRYVFTVEGRPYRWIDHRTWQALCARAGAPPGFRFHDLRHTAFTWLAQAGVDAQRLQRLGGWSTLKMVERYTHLQVDDLREAIKVTNL
jgi:integrase